MSYVTHDGTKIYFEVEGHGKPIVLSHGLTGNTTYWTGYGFVDRLKDNFMVINYDTRGHGKSDKPHQREAYDYHLTAEDVTSILDTLGVEKAHFWGYSMGGSIGFGMAKLFPERLLSLIIGGQSGYTFSIEEANRPSPMLEQFRRGVNEGTDAAVEGLKKLWGSITPQYETRLRELDFQAMVSAFEYHKYEFPGLGEDVLKITLPCLFYSGELDDSYEYGQKIVKILPNARFFPLPGLDHVAASDAVDQIMPEVLSFLACVDEGRSVSRM